MGRSKKLKPQEVTDALKQSHGLKTGACEILGVSFPTLERYVAELPEAREIIEHFRIRRTDRAEYKLDEAIERGEAWAVALTLKDHRGGRNRGYGDKGEIPPSDTDAARETGVPAELIAPAFLNVYRDIKAGRHTEYVFYGGRGSTKSSFVSLAFINLLVNKPNVHGLALRQVKDTLRDSVYAQLVWAITQLGLDDKFKCTVSPLQIEYLPTGQLIYFRGADDPAKIKSLKPPFGYIGLLWFEELDSFYGTETVRNIEQSAIRGGDTAHIFKSFNPPRTSSNWANKYLVTPKETQYQHGSDYTTVPPEWLGKIFLDEAEHLRASNPTAYEHEYLGIVNGTGGMVFDNVTLRRIEDAEIEQFDNVLQGVDWGFYPDPYAWVKVYYDPARLTLYIFDEYRVNKASNVETYNYLVNQKGVQPNDLIIADSAEPKSIGDYREYNLNVRAAEKGKESRRYSYKWLQSLNAIIIDNTRAPQTAMEFIECEYERTRDGEVISEIPQKNDHSIDAVRYACNFFWRQRGK